MQTAANSCTATGSVTVTVANGLIVTNGPPIEICEGETVVINGQTVGEAGVYCDTIAMMGGCDSVYCVEVLLRAKLDTIFLDTAICLGASVEFEGEIYSDEGEYCVTLPGQNNCDSVRCLVLLVDDLGIKLTIDSTICPGDSVMFEGQFYAAEGEYCNTYSTPEGCDSLSCLNLSWHPLPPVQILGVDTVSNGDTLVLGLEPSGPFGSIFWYQNDSLLADCTGELFCETFPTDSLTTFLVQITDPVTGCPGSDTLQVIVIPNCNPEKVEVPNAFSPNNDDKNDVFDIVGPGAEATLNMRIWNRWGQKVYDGPGPWDGKQNGKEAPSDVYIYRIVVGCAVAVDAVEQEVKGDVTLLR
ncbi:MAG: gliding motility-associated C-terminal domain-containing protein [Saprospiraceae bacterium]|nr:gliding motility-associated C-terminal domain-containing protein [Saprospiraceae bacterium]